jgi:hypothetical protein
MFLVKRSFEPENEPAIFSMVIPSSLLLEKSVLAMCIRLMTSFIAKPAPWLSVNLELRIVNDVVSGLEKNVNKVDY